MVASKRYAVLSFTLRSFLRRCLYWLASVAGDRQVLVSGYHPDGHRVAAAGDDRCVLSVTAHIEPQTEELQVFADTPSHTWGMLPDSPVKIRVSSPPSAAAKAPRNFFAP